MPELHLLNDIAIALGLALAGGVGARIIGVSPILGYLLAGMIISPFTPGYDADLDTLRELAELGVIFLMFGVGLHFNLGHLAAVKDLAVAGAVIQTTTTAVLGAGIAALFGFGWREGVLLGLSIAVASTVVLVRSLDERGLVRSLHGQVAIGWLVVEDIATVLVLVIVPVIGGVEEGNVFREGAIAIGKAAVFLGVMLTVGARVFPWLLGFVARTGSRELFTLAVIAGALGIATGASLFGVSVALGAFVAGVVVSETETSQQAAAEALPFREAFAVLFFVSVGMILDPGLVRENLGLLATVCVVVIIGKSLVALVVAAPFPYPLRTGLVVAAGLAQVGEFSFILAGEGLAQGVMTEATYNVILAASAISIALNPLMWAGIPAVERALGTFGPLARRRAAEAPMDLVQPAPEEHDLVLILGYGRVGQIVASTLRERSVPYVVVDARLEVVREANEDGVRAIWGDAAHPDVLERAAGKAAALLVVALPDSNTTLLAVANARRLNPRLRIVARARDAADLEALRDLAVDDVIVPEFEGGKEMVRHSLGRLGLSDAEIERQLADDEARHNATAAAAPERAEGRERAV